MGEKRLIDEWLPLKELNFDVDIEMAFRFGKKEKKIKVSIVDEETAFERLRCPYCDRPFTNDEVFKQWVPKHKEVLRIALAMAACGRSYRRVLMEENAIQKTGDGNHERKKC